jgi:hypothetical protein
MLASYIVALSLYFLYHKRAKRIESQGYFQVIILIGTGLLISFLLYRPVLDGVLNNKFSSTEASHLFVSIECLPQILSAFLSNRFLLLPFIFVGLVLLFRRVNSRQNECFFILLCLLVLPFVLSFFHQKMPFQRTFVILGPIFCVLITTGLLQLIQRIPNLKLTLFCLLFIPCYSSFVFIKEMKKNEVVIEENLQEGGRQVQNIYQNYYLSKTYNPRKSSKYLGAISRKSPIIVYSQIDLEATSLYLRKNGLEFIIVDSFGGLKAILKENDKAFVLTSYETLTMTELSDIRGFENSVVMDEFPINTIIQMKRIK